MKTTEKFGLNLLEASDHLSIKPLNENAKKLEDALTEQAETFNKALTGQKKAIDEELSGSVKTLKTAISGRTMMATGSYTGTGAASVTISTPGFTPSALIMLCAREQYVPGSYDSPVDFSRVTAEPGDFACTGFAMWNGKDINAIYWYENGTTMDWDDLNQKWVDVPVYSKAAATVKFTPSSGKLKWELTGMDANHVLYKPARQVNNVEGVEYKWIAFGVNAEK